MEAMSFVWLVGAAALGAAAGWFAARAGSSAEVARLEATLESERKAAEAKLSFFNEETEKFREAFKALSADALKDNRQEFLDLAQRSLLAPIKESLDKVGTQVKEIERARQEAYGSLTEQVRSMVTAEEKLRSETGNLVKALRSPMVRGRWGEIQLRRVVEFARAEGLPLAVHLAEVAQLNKRVYRAYLLKEELRAMYLCGARSAGKHLRSWLAWASRSKLAPFVTLAATLRKYRDGVLAAIRYRLSNGRLEGLNNKIRLLSHRAYGFHSAAALIAMVYLCCGGLTVELPT